MILARRVNFMLSTDSLYIKDLDLIQNVNNAQSVCTIRTNCIENVKKMVCFDIGFLSMDI